MSVSTFRGNPAARPLVRVSVELERASSAAASDWVRMHLTTRQAARLRKLARLFRAEHRREGRVFEGGHVTVWSGMAEGWSMDLTARASEWRPGVYAVPADDHAPILVATGGSYQAGAAAWTETEVSA